MVYILMTDNKGIVGNAIGKKNAYRKAQALTKELNETVYISYDSGQDGYIDVDSVTLK